MAKKSETATTKKPVSAAPTPPPLPPVRVGQIVYVTVLPKPDIAGNVSDASPKLFATREAAQADCDDLNKMRSEHSQFIVREMKVH